MQLTHLFKFTFLLISLFSFAFAQQDEVKKKLLTGYVEVQERLAADDLPGAKNSASNLLASGLQKSNKDLKSAFAQVNKASTLESARDAFKKVSKLVIELEQSNLANEYIIAYCPMAGAKWIQKNGDLRNPYFGKEMLTCGEKI